jgi:hypothetical protein
MQDPMLSDCIEVIEWYQFPSNAIWVHGDIFMKNSKKTKIKFLIFSFVYRN